MLSAIARSVWLRTSEEVLDSFRIAAFAVRALDFYHLVKLF